MAFRPDDQHEAHPRHEQQEEDRRRRLPQPDRDDRRGAELGGSAHLRWTRC